MADDTHELLRRMREGDRASLEALLERYRPRLTERVRLMLGDDARRWAETADFVQTVMVDVMRDAKHVQVQDGRGFLRWLSHVARNNVRDLARRRRLESVSSFSRWVCESSPWRAASDQEQLDRVLESIEELSPEHRRVLELRYFAALPFADVAVLMKRSAEATKQLHRRALLRLGRCLRAGDAT
ncbi:MAG: sigma-70 family RNA polymerase sigma factor [Planctomycetota bacterium]